MIYNPKPEFTSYFSAEMQDFGPTISYVFERITQLGNCDKT